MNNEKTPEGRYSLRKRLKVKNVKKGTPKVVKETNIMKLREIFKFFTYKKEELKAELKMNDCIQLITLERTITEILNSSLFNGTCDKSGTIQDRILHEAIENNNLPLLKKLIKNEFLRESICKHEIPPLFELIAKKKFEILEIFYKAGISFEGQITKSGMPLLHFVLLQKGIDKDFVKKLLYYGAELSAKDSNDLTPLHFLLTKEVNMSNWRKMEFLKLFLKFGANANSCSQLVNETPLHTAVRNRNPYAVQYLLLYGADVNLKNINNDTAFHLMTKFHTKSTISAEENYISRAFVKHFYWMKINRKEIDWQISSRRRIIGVYKHTKLESKLKKTSQQFNGFSILTLNESKLAKVFHNENLNVSKIIKNPPYVFYKRLLKFRIKKAKQRYVLQRQCETSFMQFTRLPSVFVQQLFKTLTTVDLRSLYAALCPESFMEKLIIEPVKLSDNSDDDDDSSTVRFSSDESSDNDLTSYEESDDFSDLKESSSDDENENSSLEDVNRYLIAGYLNGLF